MHSKKHPYVNFDKKRSCLHETIRLSRTKFAFSTIVILISRNKNKFYSRCGGYYLHCANLISFFFLFLSHLPSFNDPRLFLFQFSACNFSFQKTDKFFTYILIFFFQFSESLREYNGLSSDLYKPSNYDKLALSLLSPLPNEQDFAINVCTLLSNEGKHILRLDKYPRLVNILLAHAGVFDSPGTRQLFIEVYSRVRNYSINSFWSDVLDSQDVIDLTNERTFMKKPTTASPQTFSRRKILEKEKQNKSAASTENGDEASTSMEIDGVRTKYRISRVLIIG